MVLVSRSLFPAASLVHDDTWHADDSGSHGLMSHDTRGAPPPLLSTPLLGTHNRVVPATLQAKIHLWVIGFQAGF